MHTTMTVRTRSKLETIHLVGFGFRFECSPLRTGMQEVSHHLPHSKNPAIAQMHIGSSINPNTAHPQVYLSGPRAHTAESRLERERLH